MATQAVATTHAMPPALKEQVGQALGNIKTLLPPDIDHEQFRAAIWLEYTGRPALMTDCTEHSNIQCIVKSATYGLLPGRDVHFLPFKSKRQGGKKEATWVPNYQGIQRALDRTGKVRKSFAHPVYTNDHFEIDILMETFSHRPNIDDPGKLRCFYGAIFLVGEAIPVVQVMTLDQVNAIRARSPAHDSGPWATDYVAMGRKTALKQVAKYVNLTPQVHEMLADDEERERQDIPTPRLVQHIGDMFGDDAQSDPMRGDPCEMERTRIMTACTQYGIPPGKRHNWIEVVLGKPGMMACNIEELKMIFQHVDTHQGDAFELPDAGDDPPEADWAEEPSDNPSDVAVTEPALPEMEAPVVPERVQEDF